MSSEIYAGSFIAEQWSRTDGLRIRSEIEQAADALEVFARVHEQSLNAIEQIRANSRDAQLALLMQMTLDEKRRHQSMLRRITITLRDALNWTRSADALPSHRSTSAPVVADLISTTCAALEEERASARSLRRLAVQLRGINAGLMSVLMDAMAVTSEKHARLLQFVITRLRSQQATEAPWPREVARLLLGQLDVLLSRREHRGWTSLSSPHSGGGPLKKPLLVALVSAALLAFGALAALARPTPAPAPDGSTAVPSPAFSQLVERSATTDSACSASGDIVGDANPMHVYATLCSAAGSSPEAETVQWQP